MPLQPSYMPPELVTEEEVNVHNTENFSNDFSQKYKGTSVVASWPKGKVEAGISEVVLIEGTNGQEDHPKSKDFDILCRKFGEGELTRIPFKTFVVEKPLPQSGFYNFNNHTIFYSRIPERQWRRGFCSQTMKNSSLNNNIQETLLEGLENNKFKFPGGPRFASIVSSQSFFDLTVANGLFFPQYPTYKNTHHILKSLSQCISQAFYRDFALSLCADTENFALFHENCRIAEVDPIDFNKVYVKEKLFFQEIIDLFRRIEEPQVQVIRV